jgi:hypothetical protein
VYVDRLDANRARTGERLVGICDSFSIQTSDEVRDKYDTTQATAPLIKSVNVRRTPEIRFALSEWNPENLELAFMGTKANFAQTGASKSNYVPPAGRVKKGYWFPLEDPAGTERRTVSAITVTGPSSSPTYVLGTDYLVDAVAGRIFVIPAGAIADGGSLEVDFTYATISGSSLPYVQGGVSNFIEAFVRVIGKPATGPTQEVQIWIASLSPDGEVSFFGDDYGEFPIRGRVLADSVNHPTEPLYRVLEVAA